LLQLYCCIIVTNNIYVYILHAEYFVTGHRTEYRCCSFLYSQSNQIIVFQLCVILLWHSACQSDIQQSRYNIYAPYLCRLRYLIIFHWLLLLSLCFVIGLLFTGWSVGLSLGGITQKVVIEFLPNFTDKWYCPFRFPCRFLALFESDVVLLNF